MTNKTMPKSGDVITVFCQYDGDITGVIAFTKNHGPILVRDDNGGWTMTPSEREEVEQATGSAIPVGLSTGWWVHDKIENGKFRIEQSKTQPVTPSAPMARAVLDLIKAKGSLTSLEASGVLKCRDLPKRISELKSLGWPIKRELKNEVTMKGGVPVKGQRYARYYLEAAA